MSQVRATQEWLEQYGLDAPLVTTLGWLTYLIMDIDIAIFVLCLFHEGRIFLSEVSL